MKRLAISLLLVFFGAGFLSAQDKNAVLLTIDDHEVTLSEFERIYNKNNSGENVIDSKSKREYLELFINFKLKVLEAQRLGLDTMPKFTRELEGYRKQLAAPYLTDKSIEESLIKEAYERMQKKIRASHILIRLDPNAPPEDTLKAYQRINKIRDLIVKEGKDFETVAVDSSEDQSAKFNNGDLGFFTAFSMIYKFENKAYKTPIGKVSMPFRTRFGYHIIKVTDKRENKGSVKVAHIMTVVPKDASQDVADAKKQKIEEAYQKLEEGMSFDEVVQKYSEDRSSKAKNGELKWFGTGKMVPEFELAAFSLEKPGDYTEPIKTSFGWHIVKLIDTKPLAPYEELQTELKRRIEKDPRSNQSQQRFIARLKEEYGFKEYAKNLKKFTATVDTSIFNGNWKIEDPSKLKKPLFKFNDKTITQKDFAEFLVEKQRKRPPVDVGMFVSEKYKQFVNQTMLDYEESRLNEKYPEYRYLLQEYHDGILLFDLTDKMVWSKAMKDSTGLNAFYEKNKEKYMWGKRYKGVIYICKNEEVKKKVKK